MVDAATPEASSTASGHPEKGILNGNTNGYAHINGDGLTRMTPEPEAVGAVGAADQKEQAAAGDAVLTLGVEAEIDETRKPVLKVRHSSTQTDGCGHVSFQLMT